MAPVLNLFVPGLLVMISFMLVVYVMARRNGLQAQTNEGPQRVIDALIPIAPNAFVLLILVNIFLILIHTVLEAQTTILVIVPLLMPTLAKFNVSLVHFGVILNLNSAMGLILPPIGICLYIVSSTMGVPIARVARFALPFVAVLAADLALVVAFPQLSTFFLPKG